jgi:ubiquinone/menaquinone biosynthesis C-methylase UbiE
MQSLRLRSCLGKQLVAFVRQGDYAHPGEEESIKMLMQGIKPNKNRLILDVGCGLGGTAKFVQDFGLGKVIGVDLDVDTIEYAKKTYPEVEFHVADVLEINRVLKQKFDLIYLFNSFYSFPKQQEALQVLRSLAHDSSELLIFDLVDLSQKSSSIIEVEIQDRLTRPLVLEEMKIMLQNSGWQLLKYEDLKAEHIRWYAKLLTGIKEKREAIITQFGENAYQSALIRYTNWYEEIVAGRISGGIFRARAKLSDKK